MLTRSENTQYLLAQLLAIWHMLCQTAKKKQTIDINDGNVIHITRTNKEIRHIKYASEKNAHLATS